MADRLLNTRQACVLAGISPRTLYYWMASGKLPYVVVPSGGRRVRERDLVREPVAADGTVAPHRERPGAARLA